MTPDGATPEPPRDCPLCPRLLAYRNAVRERCPDWHNGAVSSSGDPDSRVLVLGLAPGLKGANRTGRPFTGDASGDLLFATLGRFGFASGSDGDMRPKDCLITNAVRCVPPQNRPSAAEITACRPFLAARIAAMPNLRAVLCLGRIAHEALLCAQGVRHAAHPFAHGARHDINGLAIFDSYHCSRYNISTRRLTPVMFEAVIAALAREAASLP